jgi:signal transduction histidine kinase
MRAYVGAIAAVGLATAGTALLQKWIGVSMSVLYFPAVVVPALYGGFGPSLLATALSTFLLAFLFTPPRYSLVIGADDGIRLLAFVVVSYATAWASSARRRAEEAQRESLRSLQAVLDIMRNVSAWPLVIDADTSASMRRILAHGAAAIGATTALAVWEAEEEPWVYVTSARGDGDTTSRHAPSLFAALLGGGPDATTSLYDSADVASIPRTVGSLLPDGPLTSVPFQTEHLVGRVLFGGLPQSAKALVPAAEVVAREIGNSLDHLYVADRSRALAIREDRLRVSRDLHDGVLQALTGIRLEIQDIAQDCVSTPATHDRLLAAERALALEQRALRTFIDGLKPDGPSSPVGSLASHLEATAGRLSLEWKTPVTVRVALNDIGLRTETAHAVRMMVHEAIVNALKHGHPSRVSVAIDAGNGQLAIAVSDDGSGFPFRGEMDHEALTVGNLGPASLRDRVTALGGRLSIASAATGSRVDITLPI